MRILFQSLMFGVLSLPVFAQIDQPKEIQTAQTFGDYTIHYNVFNSSKVPPQVAKIYQLVRGDDRALVNISLTKTESGNTTLGLPADIKGATRNLMQQRQQLKFIEIKEGEATYYLAPFVFNNEEVLHFDIEVTQGDNKPMSITFNRTLYTD